MVFLYKILAVVIGIPIGIFLMTHSYQVTQMFGHNSLAEQYLGTGGTYTMWKLLGTILIVAAVLYLFS
jgi:hypothetical protein